MEKRRWCSADVCADFCDGCIFNLLVPPFSTCSHKWVLMKNLIPRSVLLPPQTCSSTGLPVQLCLFLFHLSSSTPHSLIPPLLAQLGVNNVCRVLREASETQTKVLCWWGSAVPNFFLPPMLCCFFQFSRNVARAYAYRNRGICWSTCIHMNTCGTCIYTNTQNHPPAIKILLLASHTG